MRDKLAVHDVETLSLTRIMDVPATARAICVSESGEIAYFGTSNGYVGALDLNDFEITDVAKLPGQVWSMALSHDETSLLAGLSDQTARLLQLSDGAELAVYRGHKRRVTSVAFLSPEHGLSTSLDGSTRIWDLASERCEHTFTGHLGAAVSVLWNPAAQEIVSCGSDGFLRTWLWTPSPAGYRTMDGPGWPASIAFHPDGRTIAAAERRGPVYVLDAWTGEAVRILQADIRSLRAVAFSPDGRHLFSAGGAGQLHVWNAQTYELERVFEVGSRLDALAVHPDSREVAAAGSEGVVRRWDPSTGVPPRRVGKRTRTNPQPCL